MFPNFDDYYNQRNNNLYSINSTPQRSSNLRPSLSQINVFNKTYSPDPVKAPTAGIPFKNILKKNEDDISALQCPICYNLIWEPFACEKCGQSFCEFCINNSLLKSGNFCPLCKARPFKKTSVKAILRKFLNRIRIKCVNPNCKEKTDYFNYLSHIENCYFRLYHCDNEGCNYHDILDNIKIHSTECKYRTIKCKYCSKEIKEYSFESHVNNSCGQNILCPKCGMKMTRGFYNSRHKSQNNENIICLQNQLKIKDDLINKMTKEKEVIEIQKNEKINSLKKKINSLKEEISKEKIKNKNLNTELSDFKNSIQNIYDNLILKKNKSERLSTYENVNKNNNYFLLKK